MNKEEIFFLNLRKEKKMNLWFSSLLLVCVAGGFDYEKSSEYIYFIISHHDYTLSSKK